VLVGNWAWIQDRGTVMPEAAATGIEPDPAASATSNVFVARNGACSARSRSPTPCGRKRSAL